MIPTGWNSLHSGAARLDRPDAGVLILEDSDRADFLQRLTTNNVGALRDGQALVTVLTSPTARILYTFTVLCRADVLWLLPWPGEGAALERHLRGQIFFMDKVRVRDVGGHWRRVRVAGPLAAQTLAAAGLAAPTADDRWVEGEGVLVLAQARFDLPGYELIVPADRAATVASALQEAGIVAIDDESARVRRIELGRPSPGAELTQEVSPLEAGLAWACAENKGCYTGQEILARQITYDKVTRTLVGLQSDVRLPVGSALSHEGREVGRVTSSALRPGGSDAIALGIVKRPHNEPGQKLLAGNILVNVVALPFDGQSASESAEQSAMVGG